VTSRTTRIWRFLFIGVVAALLAAGCGANQEPLAPGDYEFSLSHQLRSRSYLLHVPPPIEGDAARPLVIMLHGGTGTAAGAAALYGWPAKSDAEGFLVAFPDGVGRTWNAEHCCGPSYRQDVDDVGFIASVIDDIAKRADVDRRRIFATGMSNGAMMSYRLAAERADLFAAIGPVAGSIGGQVDANSPMQVIQHPDAPVAVIIFHGKQDMRVKYDGGETVSNISPGRIDLSVADAVNFWVSRNETSATPTVETNDTGHVTHSRYAAANGYGDVELYAISDQGHAWPGGLAPSIGGIEIGDPPSTEVSATDKIWAFFAAHPKPNP